MHSRISLIIMYLIEVIVVLMLVGVVFSLRGILTPASAGAALAPTSTPGSLVQTTVPAPVLVPPRTATPATAQQGPIQLSGPTVGKNAPVNLEGKFQITYVGEFRDRIIFAASESDWKYAKGIYATIQFRIKNLQPGADSLARNYTLVAITDDGETIASDPTAEASAVWLYCQCDTLEKMIPPGGESVFVIPFDVPVSTQRLIIAPTRGGLTNFFSGLPRFSVADFDKVHAWKR